MRGLGWLLNLKVQLGALPALYLWYLLDSTQSISATGKSAEDRLCNEIASGQPASHHKEGNVVAGAVNFTYPSSTVGRATLLSPAEHYTEGVGPQSGIIRHPSEDTTTGKKILVVEDNSEPVPWLAVSCSSHQDRDHGLKQQEVGCTPRSFNTRRLEGE